MPKFLVPTVLGLCMVVGLVVYLNRPEPTPADRLEDAINDAGTALKDAGEAISEGVEDVRDGLKTDMKTAAASLESMSIEASKLVTAWQEAEIVTEDGFNFDNAILAVEESSLDAETKDQLITVLDQARAAPETLNEKLRKIQTILEDAD